MKRALITGIGGFTGRYLAPKLAAAGYEVHGTVHGDDEPSVPQVTGLHRVDIGDRESVARLLRDLRPDKIVHLAAISFVAHADISEMYRTNILGTRNILDALATGDRIPSAVIVASSANIYGNARQGEIDETVPPAPVNDYGLTKAAAELVASLYRKRLPLIVVRPFNYTGKGQPPNFLIPKIVSHVQTGAAELELGNLDVARDFSDVRTIVDAYARLLECEEAIGGTFNICSGQSTSLAQIVELVEAISGRELRVRVNPAFVRSDEVKVLRGSPARIEKVIGPLAKRPLEETLRWMLEG
jgi:nucleoside-diphosphate-sugar epimerase